jgi:hypothetical protein
MRFLNDDELRRARCVQKFINIYIETMEQVEDPILVRHGLRLAIQEMQVKDSEKENGAS